MITLEAPKPVNALPRNCRRKVFSEYYDSEFGKPHPMIRMRGKYLADLGFNVGDAIDVRLDFGRITISKARPLNGREVTR
jgi:hypothetical protein